MNLSHLSDEELVAFHKKVREWKNNRFGWPERGITFIAVLVILWSIIRMVTP